MRCHAMFAWLTLPWRVLRAVPIVKDKQGGGSGKGGGASAGDANVTLPDRDADDLKRASGSAPPAAETPHHSASGKRASLTAPTLPLTREASSRGHRGSGSGVRLTSQASLMDMDRIASVNPLHRLSSRGPPLQTDSPATGDALTLELVATAGGTGLVAPGPTT
jgi:hypothetical protein